MENAPAVPLPPVKEKKRYEWIDNARIVAAFLIMYHHLLSCTQFGGTFGSDYLHTLVMSAPLSARVPFFLVLAGYFLARNVTWKKAFDRFIWLLIPFVIWNAIDCYILLGHPFTVQGLFTHLLGINYIVDSRVFCLFGVDVQSRPDIAQSWFLRDIMLLSLLTPIIVRFRKWLGVALVFIASVMMLNCKINSGALFAPATLFFYVLGVSLSECRISDAYRILNPSFTKYFVGVLVASVLLLTLLTYMGIDSYKGDRIDRGFATLFGMLVGVLLIAYSGVLIERHLPRLSRRLAPCGPACFLVFMLHGIFFSFTHRVLPNTVWNSPLVLLVPFVAFLFIVAFFLGMKRYTPFLMPYLGHMKIAKKPKEQPAPKVAQ